MSRTMFRLSRAAAPLLSLVFLLFAGGASAATIITVGAGCQYTDLQTAINSVGTTGTFEFHVRGGYVSGPIAYNNKSIWIFGGYANCNDAEPVPFDGQNFTTLSVIDGARSPGHPGITVTGTSRLAVHNFQIRNATNPNHSGGGIFYDGSGARAYLALRYVNIDHNTAREGAGVYFNSAAYGTEHAMVIGEYARIEYNTAENYGGGVYLGGNVVLTATGYPSSISNNTATPPGPDTPISVRGYGGGLALFGSTVANIGSPGWAGAAFIDRNHAESGGGVLVDNTAALNLYSVLAGQPARIENNSARSLGGGVYMVDGGFPYLCVVGGGINLNYATDGTAVFANANLMHGASIVFDTDTYACGGDGLPDAVACVPGRPCNTMIGNFQVVSSPNNLLGATFRSAIDDTQFTVNNLAMHLNWGNYAIVTANRSRQIKLNNCDISANHLDDAVIRNTSTGSMQVANCSIGGNTLGGGAPVFLPRVDTSGACNPLQIMNTIVWQPGHASFDRAGGAISNIGVQNAILADAYVWNPADFTVFSNVSYLDPKFVNLAAGDLHLASDSPAIDASATGTPLDLDLNPRGIDVPQGPDSPNLGPYDLGAYEVQSIAADDYIFIDGFDVVGATDAFRADVP